QTVGLSSYYNPGSEIWELVSKLKTIAFYKPSDIPLMFEKIRRHIKMEDFEDGSHEGVFKLLDYFQVNWIEKWPIRIWCQFNQQIRTDNLSECYHSSLVKRLSCKKPTIGKLIIHLMKIEESEINKIKQMDSGNNHFYKRPTKIYNLTLNYYSNSSSQNIFQKEIINNVDHLKWTKLYELDVNTQDTIDLKKDLINYQKCDENYVGEIKDYAKYNCINDDDEYMTEKNDQLINCDGDNSKHNTEQKSTIKDCKGKSVCVECDNGIDELIETEDKNVLVISRITIQKKNEIGYICPCRRRFVGDGKRKKKSTTKNKKAKRINKSKNDN
ncbi:Hypothetical protein EIN_017830, partial [Entamoeba invadens IP1]|uniref:Hypothetical protein n=1 Tax=Entamoeba invadens IP1 TaxID=370355 RepID=UPI0002C3FA54